MANCTTHWVATAADTNCFTFDAVFLLGEGEGNMVGLGKDRNQIKCGVKDVAFAAEGDIAEEEGGIFVVGSGVAVFARAHDEE